MANISLLCGELLDHIFHYTGREDLAKISVACRSIGARAFPFLYRNVNWTWEKSEHGTSQPTAHLLLRSIVENTTLAELVRDVNIQAIGFRIRTELNLPITGPKLSSSDLINVNQAIRDSELPQPEIWQQALAEGRIDATVAFFFTRLPKLKRLVISPDFQSGNNFLTMAFQHVLTASPSASTTRFEHL